MTTVLQRLRPRRPVPARWTRRRTQSLCPRCLAVIDAELICHDNQIFMRKTCPQHGPFKELISTDADFFMRLERLSTTTDAPSAVLPEQAGPHERADQQTSRCPNQCGICPQHRSGAVMVNIDLTNRCNLRCPICFANSDAAGYLYEVTRQQVRQMLRRIMETNRPAPACIQFSGGEPTLHPEFIEILADAHQAGFAQVQVASNGLRFARQPDFAQRCSDAGLNIVYLQFDGLDDRNYLRTRGARLLELKLQAIENIYNAGMRTCLVPTIVKGINDDQIGPILQFAVDNVNKIAAISWQPVSFTGRIDETERLQQRFTLADLARCIHEQTHLVDMYRDWYPFSFVEPFCRFVEAITGEPAVRTGCHGHCGMGTYLVVNPRTRQVVPFPKMLDIEPMMVHIGRLADRVERRPWLSNRWHLGFALRRLRRFYRPEAAPQGWNFNCLASFMASFMDFGTRYPDNKTRRADLERVEWRILLLAAMHFQDVYNFEISRVQHCVIHYAAPDGRTYPFCTYNCGPCFRNRVERQFARPMSRAGPQ